MILHDGTRMSESTSVESCSGRLDAPDRGDGPLMDATRTHLRIRPRRSLMTTATVSTILAMIPIFGALYWHTIPSGPWSAVLIAHAIVFAGSGIVQWRQSTVFAEVTDTHLQGRGIFSPMVRVPLDRIAEVLLIDTYTSHTQDLVTQMLVLDRDGRPLWRMRGNFWHAHELRALADALPVVPEVGDEPLSMAAFFREYPGSAYWFEDKPVIRVLAITAGVAALLVGAAMLMHGLGVPLAGPLGADG